MLSAPTSTAPAASIRSISVASRAAGGKIAVDLRAGAGRKPFDVEQVLHREGHAGQRADGLAGGDAASIARALARARSAVTSVKELRIRSCCLMRASAASVDLQRRHLARRSRPWRSRRPTARAAHGEHQAVKTLAGSVSSGSGNSSTSRASRSDTSRFARTAGLQASSTGRASAFATAVDIIVQRIRGHFAPDSFFQWTGNGGCGIAVSSSLV